ncbi:hypothetical protein HI914_05558 [Erysiphe necator]|nr:hypothetical protein HI914_05558 [Erysiphe necator]
MIPWSAALLVTLFIIANSCVGKALKFGTLCSFGDLVIFRARELVSNSLKIRISFLSETNMVPVGKGVFRVFLDQATLVSTKPVTSSTFLLADSTVTTISLPSNDCGFLDM